VSLGAGDGVSVSGVTWEGGCSPTIEAGFWDLGGGSSCQAILLGGDYVPV